ncbi:MAG: TA system VapC family ribonuclease toxin [Chthoniobacterales bacterium]
MKPWLLDTNLLVALLWPAHEAHRAAQQWFKAQQRAGWATCPITQSGFVRIVSNPRFSRDAVSPREARARLQENLTSAQHRFLPASLPFAEAVLPFVARLQGHQQVTDAYLLGLALHHRARVATFDRGVGTLAGPDYGSAVNVLAG